MQLFIIEFNVNGESLTIEDKEITHQMKKVLRMKAGDLFFVQTPNTNTKSQILRYQVKLESFEASNVYGKITKTEEYTIGKDKESIIVVAMPNKRSKAELITQKLSELGINKIYFRPSERSIIKESKDKKIERLIKIAQEATEQSRGRVLPNVEFIKDISKLTNSDKTKTIIFDKSNKDQEKKSKIKSQNKILGIIGPEGGLTPKDYDKIGNSYTTQTIGNTILRTETASIIAGRIIKSIDL